MRTRNWATGLAVPVLAAVLVGVAAVVIVGGGGNGAASSSLDAGFPPARLAGTDFTGATIASPVVLDAIAAAAGTEVAAGSADGDPALWVSADGGSAWGRAVLAGPAALTMAAGELASVTHGAAGWLAIGAARAGQAGAPVVATSPDGQRWTVTGGAAALPGAADAIVTAVAAGPSGYVIVGRQPPPVTAAAASLARAAAASPAGAAAWYAPAGTRWRRAVITAPAGDSGRAGAARVGAQEMNAVTATTRGFAAVGGAGGSPAAWLSATGQAWRLVPLPLPDGAARAAFTSVAASGSAVVAAGTEVSAAGKSGPFAEISADAGATWRVAPLPSPAASAESATGEAACTVTALAAAGGGFTATGTYSVPGGEDVVVWTLPPAGRAGGGWMAATPQGTGLAGPGGARAITALTTDGATLTGVGFTDGPGGRQPTLWQSPIRG